MTSQQLAKYGGAAAIAVLAVAGMLVVRSLLAAPTPNAWPETDLGADDVIVYADRGSRPLHLHVFSPEATPLQPRAAIVFFHGGALVRTPLDQFAPQARHLANRGMVAIVAEYRVKADGGTPDSSHEDAEAALAYVREHATDLGVNPSQVGASGGSAGGWLAADLAQSSQWPDALVLFNPAVAATDATGAAPTLLLHGDADRTIPLSQARGFCDASPNCRLDVWPGGDHGFFNAVHPEAHAHTTALMDQFLTDLGWLEPER